LVLGAIALAGVVVDDDPPQAPTIELGEMYITGDLAVDSGANVVVVNAGIVPHNLAVEGGPRTPDLGRNTAAALDLAAMPAGSYTVYCAIEGHRAAGMENVLVIGA
jgi:plastocyanin